MRKREIPLKGFCYVQGKSVEVYARMPNGEYLRLDGNLDDAKRTHGRPTRERSALWSSNNDAELKRWFDRAG